MKFFNVILTSVTALSLTACVVVAPPKENDTAYSPVITPSQQHSSNNPGGIYQQSSSMSLYSDRSATQIGDIVTILLEERTVSKKNSKTDIAKNSKIGIDAGKVMGVTPKLGDYGLETSVGQNRGFNGAAKADQSNSLKGEIAVTVADVLPNGLLLVRGEKWITLTTGKEFIRVKGLLRQEDISPSNTVLSTKLADARISYSGTGATADSNQPGWGTRFFNSAYWPF